MRAFEKTAVAFASALVANDFEAAHALLTPELSQAVSPGSLEKSFRTMLDPYEPTSSPEVHFDGEFSLEDWAAKQTGDVGWAYVSIAGPNFVEAVAVTVARDADRLAIRDIEWGRP